MKQKVARAMRTFETLTDEEKKEFIEQAKERLRKGYLEESIKKETGAIMGPLGGICPYCGK